jgi:hypothetical protein
MLANEGSPLDRRVVAQFTAYADQFEFAVRDGHDFVAALVAKGIVQILARFHPYAFLKEPSAESASGIEQRPLKSAAAPLSVPDPA